jgi:hypothetical protein
VMDSGCSLHSSSHLFEMWGTRRAPTAARPIIKIEGRNIMSFRTIAFVTIFCLSAWLGASAHSGKETPMKRTHARARAEAKITVQSSEAKPYDQTASPALMEIRISETFTGDGMDRRSSFSGESTVRALQVQRDDRSASMVSVQRFRGKLAGRQGTFVLQGSETIENGKIKAKWFVVPRSGTGDLSGLRGEGGFEGDFGKGSEGTLDYWFE